MTANWQEIVTTLPPDAEGPVGHPACLLTSQEKELPLFALFERRAGEIPDKVAVATPDAVVTYARLMSCANHLAQRIQAVQPNVRAPVCVLAPQGATHLLGALACLRLGVPYVPLDPSQSPARNRQIALRAGGSVLVCETAGTEAAQRLVPRAVLIAIDDAEGEPIFWTAPLPSADDTVAVFFTSGSTGVPKGVKRHQGAFASTIDASIASSHQSGSDIYAYVGSPAVAGPLPSFYGALAVGATFVLAAGDTPLVDTLRLLAERRASILHCSISLLRLIARAPGAAKGLAHVRLVRTMGDIIEWRDIADLRSVLPLGAVIYCGYAATECSMMAGWFLPTSPPEGQQRVPLGRPVPGIRMWIDRSLQGDGDTGVVGELIVAGDRLSHGYLDDPAATAASFVETPDGGRGQAYRTGDIVRFDDQSMLHFLGRADNQVKLGGWRIELEEIEAAAFRFAGIAQAAVVARRDEHGKVVTLVLHAAGPQGSRPDGPALAAHLKAELPRHMRPAQIVLSSRLPTTSTNKIDRVRLVEMDAQLLERRQRTPAQDAIWSRPLERRIAATIARELHVASFTPEESFSALGGDSLKALQVALSLEKVFGVSMDPSALLDGRALGDLVRELADASTDAFEEA